MYEENIDGVTLGTFRDGRTAFLSDLDRRRHLYLIGKSGTGKSTTMRSMMLSDLARGRGFALLDPHGDLAEQVADSVPLSRQHDVIYVEPHDRTHYLAFNPLHNIAIDSRPLVAANVVSTFAHLWGFSHESGPRLIYFLYNATRLLLDAPGTTLLGVQKVFSDPAYRRQLLASARDPAVRSFWEQELPQLSDRDASLTVGAIHNKAGMLLTSPLREILGQIRSTVDIRRVMDHGAVLIVNLKKLGDAPTFLLGAFLTNAFAQAAEARADLPEDERRDFTLYADEFQTFGTESFAQILSQSRKWRLNLVLAHQYMGQLPTLLRQAVIGNAGSTIAFRIGGEDADALHLEMQNREMVYDYDRTGFINAARPIPLTDTPNYSAWVKLLQDGEPTETRLIDMHAPQPEITGRLDAVRNRTRSRCMRPRALVEAKIARFLAG